jgi:hypothetical protein
MLMALVSDVDRDRLRTLAEARDSQESVLSLYLNLDPAEFGTPRARRAQADSLLDDAHRRIEGAERAHEELMALREALEEAREIVEDLVESAPSARAVAIFVSRPLELSEVLRLDQPLPSSVAIADEPLIAPLAERGPREDVCAALVTERLARFLRGSEHGLRELLSFGDDVHGRHDQGGWSQARYQRSQREDVREHLVHVARVLLQTLRSDPYEVLLIACTEPLWSRVIEALHPDVRARLDERRLSVDVPDASIADVERAVEPLLAERRREHEDELLAELRERLARPQDGRAAAGLPAVLEALVERRVEVLLHDQNAHAAGLRCPRCGWMGLDAERCPVDGGELEVREEIVEDAVHAAVAQDADVVSLRERPELEALGGVAATLRF